MLDKKCIEEFLLWLTNTRRVSVSTYNQRLCAIHAFFDYVIAEEPGLMEQCVQVLDIPHKVTHAPSAHYLTPESLKPLLSMPDRSTRKGRRHLVLLTVLYDTAARVSELTDICLRDVRLEPPAVITLHGKGGKTRSVPLMKQTVALLKDYFSENNINPQVRPDMPLFWNSRRQKLTRSGVTFILQRYAEMARKVSPDVPDHITPHVMRHTFAVISLKNGDDVKTVQNNLGHTTASFTLDVYGHVNDRMCTESAQRMEQYINSLQS